MTIEAAYAIIGCGGFGREMFPLAEQVLASELSSGAASLVYVVEDHYEAKSIDGRAVMHLGAFARLKGNKRFAVAIADSKERERIHAWCVERGMSPFDLVSPASTIAASATIGEGSIIAPYALVSVNSTIGKSLHLNYYACITHDCVVGDFVTFGPRAQCNGGVVIEDGAYIGSGALIRQSLKGREIVIGRNAVVGMGAVVLDHVPANAVVVGNPARILR